MKVWWRSRGTALLSL